MGLSTRSKKVLEEGTASSSHILCLENPGQSRGACQGYSSLGCTVLTQLKGLSTAPLSVCTHCAKQGPVPTTNQGMQIGICPRPVDSFRILEPLYFSCTHSKSIH